VPVRILAGKDNAAPSANGTGAAFWWCRFQRGTVRGIEAHQVGQATHKERIAAAPTCGRPLAAPLQAAGPGASTASARASSLFIKSHTTAETSDGTATAVSWWSIGATCCSRMGVSWWRSSNSSGNTMEGWAGTIAWGRRISANISIIAGRPRLKAPTRWSVLSTTLRATPCGAEICAAGLRGSAGNNAPVDFRQPNRKSSSIGNWAGWRAICQMVRQW
jgi:hypothetical protein